MPLYEYQCDACAYRFEQIQRFSDPLVTTCPKCEGSVQKLVSSPAIQFKGTGWYVTDYARQDKKESSGTAADDEASSGNAKKESAKTESAKTDAAKAKSDAKTSASPAPSADSKPAKTAVKS